MVEVQQIAAPAGQQIDQSREGSYSVINGWRAETINMVEEGNMKTRHDEFFFASSRACRNFLRGSVATAVTVRRTCRESRCPLSPPPIPPPLLPPLLPGAFWPVHKHFTACRLCTSIIHTPRYTYMKSYTRYGWTWSQASYMPQSGYL